LISVATPARAQHSHVRHDPRRAVAHRNADAVAGPDAVRADQRPRGRIGAGVEVGKGQAFLARDDRHDRAVELTEQVQKTRHRRGQRRHPQHAEIVGRRRQQSARPRDMRENSVESAVEFARHGLEFPPLLLRFLACRL
jgi:hypothetical protein